MSDLRAQLETALGGVYSIERELGGGGMSRVFLAMDRALSRRVVIKALLPELAAEVSAKRFAREVRLAASLQQANIVPVLSAGETDGTPHYIMPFVEGRSLRDKLSRAARPSVAETIGILRDVARALAYAHERGVVHRDIKPENILLSGDAAVVTDFGVAKAIALAKRADSDQNLQHGASAVTHVGVAVGTPAYMSPEQISADPSVDHRADIYSLGCVGYELLTGSAPFAGTSVQSLFAAHLTSRPTPIADKNPDVPQALASLLMQCLEKDAGRRPQSAREILEALASIPTFDGSLARLTRSLTSRQRRAAIVVVTLLLSALAATLFRGTLTTPALASIAVVPFLNLSGDSSQEYLADGLADELATALGRVAGVRVASRSLGYAYKGQRVINAIEIGRSLSVNRVVHGSLWRDGSRMRVSVQVTSATDNNEVWSGTYQGSASDPFAVHRDITRGVVDALGGQLDDETARVLTSDAEAYDLYLRGRFLLQRRGAGVRQAAENFEHAIARDSLFALAYASLALALELRPYFEPVDARQLGPKAIAAARRALAIDNTLAEAHTALAMAHQHLYQWREADESYRRAVAANPNEADAQIQYGRFLWYTGRVAEAEPRFARARELDPYSAVASSWHGFLLFLRGERDEGLAAMRRAVEIDSSNPPSLAFLAGVSQTLGMSAEARALRARLARLVPNWSTAAAASQDPEAVREHIKQLETDTARSPVHFTRLANLHVQLGDSARFFAALERATQRGEIWPTMYSLSDPKYDFMRNSARFAVLVRRVGLDVNIFTSPTGGRVQ